MKTEQGEQGEPGQPTSASESNDPLNSTLTLLRGGAPSSGCQR